jgi:hypothetical protein
MDERTPPALNTTASSDADHASAALPPPDRLSRQPDTADAGSTVVYHGDPESVRAGFSLALSLMQASSNLLMSDIAPLAGRHTPEDN